MKKLLILAAAIVSCGSFAFATPVDSKVIPSESQAVLHLDFDAFRSSPYMEMATSFEEGEENPIKEVIEKLGFDPTKEVEALTFYTKSLDQQDMSGVVIAKAKSNVINESSIIKMIQDENEDMDISSSTKSGNKIYTIGKADEDQKADVCFVDGKTAMVGLNTELAEAINTCKSKSGKYAAITAPAGSIVSINITGIDLSEAAAVNPQAMMVKDVNAVSCFIGESAGNTFISAKLAVKDAAAAQMLQGQLSGMIQVIGMSAAQQAPELMQYIQKIQVLAEGDAVNVTFKCPSDAIVKMVKEQMAGQSTPAMPMGM